MALTLAAAGDAILTRRIRQIEDPGFAALVDVLRPAHARFVNLELTCPRAPFEPSIKGRGIYISAPPAVIDDLQWLGFDLFSNANNHALDYSASGLRDTLRELDTRGLAHAGAGATLVEARQPAYLDTPGGRVALIAVTTTWSERMLAADPAGRIGGRTGINPLRYTVEHGVDARSLAALADVQFLGHRFRSDIPPGVRTHLHEPDMDAIVRSIGNARDQADHVVVSLHFHEGPGERMNVGEPAAHVVEAARRMVDAGAGAILGHGPHRLQAVEVYRGAPILYSLGNLFYMLETVEVLPPECFESEGLPPDSLVSAYASTEVHRALYAPVMWDSAVAILELCAGRSSVEIWPLDLGLGRRGTTRGVPLMPAASRGEEILAGIRELSAPFGTELAIERRGDRAVGVVGR